MAESFFSSLKKERIRNRIYKTNEITGAVIFGYIEVFYNRSKRYSALGKANREAFEHISMRGRN